MKGVEGLRWGVPRARDDGVAGGVVHDEVEVPLAVALIVVLEAVVLVGEGVKAGREEDNLRREDGQLALLTLGKPRLGGGPSNASATRIPENGLQTRHGSLTAQGIQRCQRRHPSSGAHAAPQTAPRRSPPAPGT